MDERTDQHFSHHILLIESFMRLLVNESVGIARKPLQIFWSLKYRDAALQTAVPKTIYPPLFTVSMLNAETEVLCRSFHP